MSACCSLTSEATSSLKYLLKSAVRFFLGRSGCPNRVSVARDVYLAIVDDWIELRIHLQVAPV